ncbi:hypothetical protein CY34DRAFT_690638 [Suillus luteus UH-Slu-Lm8-n1]|uniref:Uncharacterized protein n=1 Tax=Suillus luteus UH-Slu-Lm8-n1 TaxID=930992 RepID=A0A0D0BBL8_9AGAM|nr:hypothetical protein CY34DRAFT_690638 [Suillus luteus UH-Slu-Lm8-n1]
MGVLSLHLVNEESYVSSPLRMNAVDLTHGRNSKFHRTLPNPLPADSPTTMTLVNLTLQYTVDQHPNAFWINISLQLKDSRVKIRHLCAPGRWPSVRYFHKISFCGRSVLVLSIKLLTSLQLTIKFPISPTRPLANAYKR